MSMTTLLKTTLIITALLACIGLPAAGYVFYSTITQTTQPETPQEWKCLGKGEYVKMAQRPRLVGTTTVTIYAEDNTEKYILSILDTSGNVDAVDIRQCGIYVLKEFGYDYNAMRAQPGFKTELVVYDYTGRNSRGLVTLASKSQDGVFNAPYLPLFSISSNEQYITLIRGYAGRDDYALVIKSLETKEDLFTLPLQELFTEVGFGGSLEFLNWTNNDRYFWTSLFEGAYTQGWIRIDTTDWSYEVYKAPGSGTDTMNGYPLNTTTGWIPYIPGSFWSGIVEIDEQINEDRKQQGETATLHLYNIFTKEDRVIYESNTPTWQDTGFFWKDDTTLEYTNPETGERVEYVVE